MPSWPDLGFFSTPKPMSYALGEVGRPQDMGMIDAKALTPRAYYFVLRSGGKGLFTYPKVLSCDHSVKLQLNEWFTKTIPKDELEKRL